jgi:teichuronic acid biosynthesis glycosyltransferase TuaG
MKNYISVNIILPNYNSSKFLEETIQSIINQDYSNWKLIIIDDCSDEKTKNILNNYKNHQKIKILYLQKNMGAGFCRNLGLRIANSRYTAFIDSDDKWSSNKISEQVNFMELNKFDFSYTNYTTFTEKDILREIKPPKIMNFNSFVKNTSICTSSMMISTKYARGHKFTKTKICEDYFYKCSLLKKLKKANCLNLSLTKYRIREDSMQSNKLQNIYWIWKINKKYNKFNFFKNFISIVLISIHSLKKYGFK